MLAHWMSIRSLLVFLEPALIKDGSPIKTAPSSRPSIRLVLKETAEHKDEFI